MAAKKPRTARQRAAARANLAKARKARQKGGAGWTRHLRQEKRAARVGREVVNRRASLESILGKRKVNTVKVKTAPKTVVPVPKSRAPLNIGHRSINWR